MQIPLKYILRSSVSRRLTTVITMLGIALVVFVFAAVLMMANGVQKTLRATGSDENIIVLRKAAMSEIMSILDREAAGIVASLPQVARFGDGRPMVSKEVVVIINLNKFGSDGISNVTVRGVEEAALDLRPQVRIVEGRMFRWGAREVIAGIPSLLLMIVCTPNSRRRASSSSLIPPVITNTSASNRPGSSNRLITSYALMSGNA